MEKYLENKRAVVASVVAAGALGFAAYWMFAGGSAPASGGDGAETAKRSSSKRKKNKKNKKKSNVLSHGFPTAQDSADAPLYPVIEDMSVLKKMKDSERKEIADEFKIAGNHAFSNKEFDRALELYTLAIAAYDKEAVYYSNRAAVWGSWKKYEEVVKDTTEGLRLSPGYAKCYNRRAVAYESLENFHEAAMDYTSAVILENFKDDSLGNAVDRVLQAETERRVARENDKVKDFPSASFIRSYLQSFRKRALPKSVEESSEGSAEYELKLALDAVDKENEESYKQAFALIQAVTALSSEKKFADPVAESLAWEYLATFQSLCNDTDSALESINRSLKLSPSVPAYLKRSAFLIEAGKLAESEQDFTLARELDPNSPDLYYQLAQVEFLQQQWMNANSNYKRSIELDPTFTLAHIQLAVSEYRLNRIESAKKRFKDLIAENPDDSMVYNYYGEILLDLKEIEGAVEMFNKAVNLEKNRNGSVVNILPLVNKSMALMQAATGPQDVEEAYEVSKQAVAIDPQSDVALSALGQFELQMGNTKKAAELFERNARLARTVPEQIQAYNFAEAAKIQGRIASERPLVRERLEMLSRQRAAA